MEILYDPFYAYDEILATIADLPGRTNSVLAAFERLTARLTNGQVSRLSEISEAKRSEALELYSQMGKTKPALNVAQKRQPKAWDIYLSASASDSKQAERLYYLLGSSYKVFHAPKEITPGDSWLEVTTEALAHSRAMLMLFSEENVRSDSEWMSDEMQAARRRMEQDPSFRLIPVQLDSNAVPPLDFLKEYQWLSAHGGDIQDIAVQIRRSLGTSGSDDSDSDRNARVKAELDHALEEKANLAARAEQLQQEIKVTQEELTQLSSERAMMFERAANEEKHHRKALRLTFMGLAMVLIASTLTGMIAYRQLIAAKRALASIADQDRAVPHFAAIMHGHTAPVTGVAFSPDGNRIATSSSDAITRVWDAASGHELLTLTGHTFSVTGVAFSFDGNRITTASEDRTARVWKDIQ